MQHYQQVPYQINYGLLLEDPLCIHLMEFDSNVSDIDDDEYTD